MGLLAVFVGTLIIGCAPATKPDDAVVAEPGAQVGTVGGEGVAGASALQGMTVSYDRNAINDPKNVLSIKTIYFEFDSSDISEDDTEVLKHHGKYLSLHNDVKIRLEGHTDERGTREYNVALADRRAQAVKRLLLFQGASSAQITIISYGEEKPAALGHDEASWKLNRRAELVYE